ncbi:MULTISPECIES: restriction endonuclease subunit S [Lactobacillus]|uniref:restriction endonuclease subunit S n=1 Tax=Lactobacillus TaxID=1578 RepID=UPI000B5DA8BB|nr:MULTISPECIES: restriction endonuclease subunit S [Lactobacillus]OXC42062.1 hypothetical protein AYP95_09520 [Lactobacillus crispatus]OXC44567.1 hypothetical protein AYP94_06120 [Lactobacillus crispatus]PEG83486.1 restriction endonuclease subunit S [Lactobacillus sp. UMNPBX16]PEG98227.1 restriction endonuclease subunit S [Lactobacillus sp. UMNPBX8]
MKTNTLDFDAQALREKILDLAMRGKLVPQDPNDEPASVLLEKIKAEKEQLIKEKKIKKSKPLAPITDDEKPFDIPDSWEWVRLGDVINFSLGKTPRRGNGLYWDQGTIPWVSISDIGSDKYLESTKEKITETALKDSFRNQVEPKGTLLMSFKLSIGKVAILGVPAVHNEAIISIYPIINRNNITRDYLYYLLPLISNSGYLTPAIKGKTLNKTLINQLKVPFPPLSEQSRIAAKIAQLFALLRKVESSTQQYAKLQTLLKSKVLDLAMRGKLVEQDPHDEPASVLLEKIKAEKEQLVKEGKIKKSKPLPPITDEEKPFDIPDSWEWGRLGDILKPEVHKKPAKDFYYIDIASIDNQYNKVVNPKKVIVKKDKIASRARQVLENDDILFSVVRPYLRNIAMVPKDNNYKIGTTGFYVLKPYELINRKYIFCLTLSNYTVTNMTQKMRGDNSPSIRKSDIQNLIIPIPPRMEQDKIVNMIIRIYSAINLN